MSDDIRKARAAVRAAATAVADSLRLAEKESWKRELEWLRLAEESLTERLNARAMRQEVRP